MRGYPKHLNTKQDVINLNNHPEFKEQLKQELQRLLLDEPDTVTKATTLIDPADESKGWNTITIPNPNPRWKRMGFESKSEVQDILITLM